MANMKETHLRVQGPSANCHVERRFHESVTLVKTLEFREPDLQPGEYYARLMRDPAKSTAMNPDGEVLDTLNPTGRIVVSRHFNSFWLPGCRLCLVRVSSTEAIMVL